MQNGLPNIGFGLGLRAPHHGHVLNTRPRLDWFEIISENYIDAPSSHWDFLAAVRNDYPIVMHGVSLSIGSTDPLDMEYLAKIRKLAEFLEAPWISDHICFTTINGINSHDLLPVPYTADALKHIGEKVKQVQDYLKIPFALENPSSYLEFEASTMIECEFIASLLQETGCHLLLDVNNVYVSAFNHGFDAKEYIDAIPAASIAQIHLAGHKNCGNYIIDTHDSNIIEEVWSLYSYAIKTKGELTTMIEWDENIPPFEILLSELDKARMISASAAGRRAA